jgi:hypothetical protein
VLQNLFEEAIRQHASEIIADLLEFKLAGEGVVLGKRDRAKLLGALLRDEGDELLYSRQLVRCSRPLSIRLSDVRFLLT